VSDNSEIEDLKREIEALKRALPVSVDERAAMDERAKRWQNEMHQLSEQRMAHAAPWSRSDLAAFEAACPTSAVQDIVRRGTIKPPSGAGVGGTISAVHVNPGLPGSHRGWVEPRELRPPPGVAAADRLMDAQDARDRTELIAQEARRAAVRKLVNE
jgi:hypothetical protein